MLDEPSTYIVLFFNQKEKLEKGFFGSGAKQKIEHV